MQVLHLVAVFRYLLYVFVRELILNEKLYFEARFELDHARGEPFDIFDQIHVLEDFGNRWPVSSVLFEGSRRHVEFLLGAADAVEVGFDHAPAHLLVDFSDLETDITGVVADEICLIVVDTVREHEVFQLRVIFRTFLKL